MDLVDRDQGRARRQGGDRAPAVFLDGGAIVVGAETDVEAGIGPRRHAALAAEKAVRDAGQRARADDFDAHSFSRMMMSSSAWLPTMKA